MTDIKSSLPVRITAAVIACSAAAFGTTLVAAPSTAAPIVSPLHTQAPAAGELTAKLAVAVDRGAPAAARAAELESGAAGLPTMDKIADLLAAAPGLKYQVVNPVVSGDRIDAQLLVTTPGYPDFTYNVAWRQIDGTWKLTRDSECAIASELLLTCG
ncbi:hypothetical protein [Nocardia paucivorans]|uniref:hypothetical protein n=1 Tax=Nocardia paucivorans TaxID=114259 RepID=UPI0002EE7B5F|nr:hypothetical protein [Nocardia paucivorans]